MGKITLRGPVPKDDPMFSTGPEIFSRPASSPSSTTSAPATDGATPAASTSAAAKKMTPQELTAYLAKLSPEENAKLINGLM